ncbi:hybrid sensor histidine kinase/response regulator transcription factor [Dysgonomonas termitidis]|uniref:histidine kinase n=1 Tax=Dysgonomonas termitidis TaxID=1516126 RepID=A0ABV9KQ67_9BACT
MKAIIIYINLFLITLPGLSDNIYFNHLGSTQGLPQINVMSIYQDETGAMWFGTVEGICRYNGNAIQIFRSSAEFPELTHNNILSITGNKKGAIYIKANYDLIKYDIVGEKFRRLKENVNEIFYKNGKLWFITDDQVYTYSEETDKISLYATVRENIGRVYALCVSRENDIWVGGRSGLTVLKAGSPNSKRDNLLENIYVNSIYIDKDGWVWAGTKDKGVYIFDGEGNLKHHYFHIAGKNSLSNDQVRTIFEDNLGTVWIGTFFGLNSFNKNSKNWTNYIHDDTQPHSLSHSSIFSIYEDEQGTLWIGTYFGGANYFNPKFDLFNFYNASSVGKNNLSFPFVGKMAEDRSGNLWICTEGGGLNCLNLATRKFTRYLYDGYDPDSAIRYNLKSIYYDETGDRLFIGIHNLGLCVFDLKTKSHKLLNQSIITNNALSGNSIKDISRYKNSIIVQIRGGLFRINIGEDEIKPFSDDTELNNLINSNFIYTFFIDSKDRLWLSTPDLKCIDLNTKEVKQYSYNKNEPRSIGKFEVTSILETKSGELFFGTIGSGLFRYCPRTDDFENYTQENEKQFSNFCYHISETSEGYLLLLHNNALTIFNPKNGNTLYRSRRNFPITGFFEGSSSYITRDKEVFIGGTNGLASVQESQLIHFSPVNYSLYFDKLFINNKHISPGDDSKILNKALFLCDEIDLRYNQNNLSIEFATSNYSQDAVLNYEYKLENFDENWNQASSNTIVYTNISPGEYKLLLREINPSKDIGEIKSKSLTVRISPPFYKTTFAYAIYLILLISIITGIIRFFVWRSQINSALKIERKEKEQNEKLNQMKLKFFTNISHELRTPLTLIIAQTESMLSKNPEHKLKQKISKVLNNATHMRDLISELLDFRKQEQGFYRLKIEKVDLVEYIKGIYESFTEYAGKHHITYIYDFSEDRNITAYIDRAQFKKAIYNLLSNAFKYTSDSGSITIRIRDDEYIHILIEDNGIGIPSDVLSNIFERFYQVEYRTSGFSLGTGIGLALTKEIVESHRGEISVVSTINEGSIFEIKLLKGYSHFNETELKADSLSSMILPYKSEQYENRNKVSEENVETDLDVNSGGNENSPYSILIVEDNEELLELLRDAFSDKYKVYTALNGKIGLEIGTEIIPDIILSDVMMPVMSGKEMCYRIKNNINLSHIPVVMLTSQDSTDQTIEGYMFGADDYVAKPFNIEILKARCNSIVKNRQLLYRNMVKNEGSAIIFDVQSEQEEKFINKVTEIIKKNFDNPGFDMNVLASELGMGRNKLYTKMKEITNLSPNEFALNIKMRESIHLLQNYLHLNISEIGIELGFSSTKYFSRCFKAFYGTTPAQWRKDNA